MIYCAPKGNDRMIPTTSTTLLRQISGNVRHARWAEFIALNKTQKLKAVPIDWKLDQESNHVVISEFALDAKNLYEATDVEKSQVAYSLPHKLGLPPFKIDATKIKVERNYSFGAKMLESMDDYSNSYSVSGGNVFYKCECQAKHVTVTYWDKSGILDVEEL